LEADVRPSLWASWELSFLASAWAAAYHAGVARSGLMNKESGSAKADVDGAFVPITR
jgi:hypothetical protein